MNSYDHIIGAAAERPLSRPEDRTDLANSRRFARANEGVLRFVQQWESWLHYDGKRWANDAGDIAAISQAKLVADQIWIDARSNLADASVVAFARGSASLRGIKAMVSLAAPELAIDHSCLDHDQWALNVQNGTLNLKTGTLRTHDRRDWITKLAPVAYSDFAEAPRWQRFLEDVFPDADVRAFVQRLAGYSLTGIVTEHVLPILWGSGSNGKSTLLTTLQKVLGDYAGQAPSSLLMAKRGESHPCEVASLFGQRLVVASETDSGGRLNEPLVKGLTGGDLISARRMRENFWTFLPTHKLWLCTNHRPVVRGSDNGIWRRLLLIPFTQRFEGPGKDPELPAKLSQELPGILKWCVEGCLAWQSEGLNPPEAVRMAIEEYRQSEDIIGKFLAEECLTGVQTYRVKFSQLYEAADRWATDSGEALPSKRAVGAWLKDNGYQELRNNGTWYLGVALKA